MSGKSFISRKVAEAQREKEAKSIERGRGGKSGFPQIKKMENPVSRKGAKAQREKA